MNDRISSQDQSAESLLGQAADEYSERLNQGESPDIEEYANRYPKVAELIRQVFPALNILKVPAEKESEAELQAPKSAGTRQLGDYHIVREVGRGGMGVVYEAEQVSLGRKVALKVLPYAAMVDERQLQRFRNEARAAASLRHPNIVQVHFVGCERAVHFYAMDFIEGQTLAELIKHLRRLEDPAGKGSKEPDQAIEQLADSLTSGRIASPEADSAPDAPTTTYMQQETSRTTGDTARTPQGAISTEQSTKSPAYFRSIAELGVRIAEALDHAHENGVIHRDVKPSNIMLDHTGKPWITDFGLARIEADATLTISGDLLGTVRYMSPEQALAKRVVVDHRTDIYSLGATLYELLTLQPVFTGQDRQELLRQVSFEEPQSPRRINRAIPSELEVIVGKAMAKNPTERYDTAQELADDLKRFLADEPIRARRPSILQLTSKWSRRHRTLVMATILLLVITVMGTTANAILLAREQQKTSAALDEAREKSRALRDKNEELKKARQRAEEHQRIARDAVDRLFTKVAEDLKGHPHMTEIRRELLEDALEFYQGFLAQKSDDPDIRHETALTYQRVGRIHIELGNFPEARKALEQSLEHLEELASEYPSDTKHTLELASSLSALAFAHFAGSQGEESAALQRRQLEIRQKLVSDFPSVASYRGALALNHTDLANSLDIKTDRVEKEKHFRLAMSVWAKRKADFPQLPESLLSISQSRWWLAGYLLSTNQLDEAEKELRQVYAVRVQALTKTPNSPYQRGKMAHLNWYMGLLNKELGQLDEAEAYFRDAVTAREKLLDEFPNAYEHRRRLVEEYVALGKLLRDIGRCREAEEILRRGYAVKEKLVADFPDEPEYQGEFAILAYELAVVLQQTGRTQEAVDIFRQIKVIGERLVPEHPDDPNFLEAMARFLTLCPASQFRDPSRAIELGKKALQNAPQYQECWELLGTAKYQAGDFKGAVESIEKAMELYNGGHGPQWLILSLSLWRSDRKEEARQWYDKAVKWLDTRRPESEELRRFREEAEALVKEAKDDGGSGHLR